MNHTKATETLPGSVGRFERPRHLSVWLLIATGGLVAALVAVLVVTRMSSSNAYTPQFVGGARAQLSQKSFDYGDVKNNTRVNTTFTVQNVGDRQLYFPQEPIVQAVEGCCPPTTAIDKSELNPGETANVSLSFSMHEGMDGPHDFRVKVLTNDVEEPEQEVVILSNWVP